jgi:chaperonin GroEL
MLLHATRAAVEEGIVPGGGVALLRMTVLEGIKLDVADQQVGVELIRKAIQEPARQIVKNTGLEASVIIK